MNERITLIRKSENMTQEKFAQRMGISKNYVNLIENGKKNPGDRLISDICREFNINEEWLRYGKGDMHKLIEDKLSYYLSEITDGDDDFIKDLIIAYMDLDEDSKKALKILANNMLKINNKK